MKSNYRARDSFLVFGAPALGEEEIAEATACIRSGWLGTGPRVTQFEKDFQSELKTHYLPAAVNSCTAALHLSQVASGIQPGDEVITTPLTFCATVNSIIHAGGTPVLADVDPVTLNIDPTEVEKRITARTKAMIPVHFAGRACDMGRLTAIAKQRKIKLIEDCAHAIETEFHGQRAGTFGDFGCFSFYITKNVVTGEGGMVLSQRQEDHERVRMLSLHGMSQDAWKRFGADGYKHYDVVAAGFKYNMMDLQAAIGLQQLKKIDRYWLRRQAVWSRYDEEFRSLPIGLPAAVEKDTKHAFHLYTITVDQEKAGISRDSFLLEMKKRNIGVGVHYLSVPEYKFYQEKFGWKPEHYPHAMKLGRQILSLPLSASMTDQDVTDVCQAVKDILT